ncbi:cellulose-binding protein, partial [Streptomyces sp. TRM76130]|nr:cellulose-binding protein [Streptomyces sp. TRM76130]
SRHLAGCADCAEAAGCLRTDPGSLAAALADGVIGWGGLTYLERRRRAAELRLTAGRPAPADDDGSGAPGGRDARRRARAARGGLLAGAALISLLALTASLRPLGGPDTSGASAPSATATPSATAAP